MKVIWLFVKLNGVIFFKLCLYFSRLWCGVQDSVCSFQGCDGTCSSIVFVMSKILVVAFKMQVVNFKDCVWIVHALCL